MDSPNSSAGQQQSISSNKWKASTELEERKLKSSPTCKLAGSGSPVKSRTRRKGRVPFEKLSCQTVEDGADSNVTTATPGCPKRLFLDPNGTTPMSTLTTGSSSLSSTSKRKKPPETRVVLERIPLAALMERHMKCPKCQSAVKVSFPTKMIASTVRVDCADLCCGFVDIEKPIVASPQLPEGARQINRNSDAAINILFVLAFLSKGCGGTEAAHVLGLLGLPNSTTMDGSSFGSIEKQVGPTVLQKLADEVVYNNQLDEEVKSFYNGRKHPQLGTPLYDMWRERKLDKESEELWPRLTVSADMGWQGRSSGNAFNSLSGDALLVRALTRKPVAWYVMSRSCSFCKGWKRSKKKDEAVAVHKCLQTWEGSAGAMEPVAVLEMVKLLYYGFNVVIEKIVTDDDSSMKSKLKWNNHDTMINLGLDEPPFVISETTGKKVVRPDKGELPAEMMQPTFVADPNHRKKTFGGELY